MDGAVQVALLNNPGLQASLATLGISDADRVQAGSLPNPHLSLGRMVEGDKIEIERALGFNLMALLTLPWRAQWAGQQTELARLQAAQDVVRLAADTRKAWIQAVAAQQSARYMRDVKEAAEAGAELARRLARVGNWSRLNQAREAEFPGRCGGAAGTCRAGRLRQPGAPHATDGAVGPTDHVPSAGAPARPASLGPRVGRCGSPGDRPAPGCAQCHPGGGLRGRLARVRTRHRFHQCPRPDPGAQHRVRQCRWHARDPARGRDRIAAADLRRGQARNARAQGVYMQSLARVRDVGVRARSEAREAYHAYRTAYDLARHYRDEVVPLRKFINDEGCCCATTA